MDDRKGWICPVCNEVKSPDVKGCDCGVKEEKKTSSQLLLG